MMDIFKIIFIQSLIRRYLIKRYILIPSSYYQTKLWRKNRSWYKNGKHLECEKYQINLIKRIIKQDDIKLVKTNFRLNILTKELIDIKYPLKEINGFEFTENFDRSIQINNITYYFNLKFICDNGGFQIRSCREIFHFINTQFEYLDQNLDNKIYFINILDGDTCYNFMSKFTYLRSKYSKIINTVFIGDMHQFQIFWTKSFK